jgi:DnaJ-class molecular chaperone
MLTAFSRVGCPSCDGDGYHGDPEYGNARNCRRCNGRGTLLVSDLSDDEQDELEIEPEEEGEE